MNFEEYEHGHNINNIDEYEDSEFLIIKYNFCPMPLNKTKIITVNIETENKSTLGDALLKAIHGFNKIDENYRILEKTTLYKLRYSKKSGLPDQDIPPFDLNLRLNKVNCRIFSVSLDESHLFSIPRYNFDPSARKNLDKLNSTTVSITRDDIVSTEIFSPMDQSKKLLIEDSKKKKRGFFSWLCSCFSKTNDKS